MIIGAQFYTLRDFCKTPEDLSESLKKVADIGYTAVQISGTCPYDPAWLNEELKKNGLVCPLTHYDPERIANDTQAVADEHSVFGCDHVGIGWFDLTTPEKVDEFVAKYSEGMKILKANGKKLMYHNHDLEFAKIDGKVMLQLLADKTSPDELGFTLDSYWVQAGGGDYAWWLRNLKGRVGCVHYKDYAYPREMRAIGDGNMNWDAIIAASLEVDAKYAFVEQDNCNGLDPFDCLKRSYDFLSAQGLK
ncbi:MAG: sugar phosphate isomerase/epimerase [Clostridia bacterium]|nr:sugar phosphate isomerase/epimerase [Clostridia bacterium]